MGCLRGSDAYGRSPGEPVFDGEQRVLRNPVAFRIVWKCPRREDARVHMQAPLAQIPREEIWPTRLEHETKPPGFVDVDRALPMPVLHKVVDDAGKPARIHVEQVVSDFAIAGVEIEDVGRADEGKVAAAWQYVQVHDKPALCVRHHVLGYIELGNPRESAEQVVEPRVELSAEVGAFPKSP